MRQNEPVSGEKPLTAKQLKAIPDILSTNSVDEASKKAKIARATINRWMKLPLFKETVETKRQEIFEAGLNRLKCATEKASITMIKLLDSKDENVRRLSAKDILAFALKALETQDLEERIERLEEIIEKRRIS